MARKIAVIDAETDPFMSEEERVKYYGESGGIPKSFLWGFYDGHEYRQFENVVELIDYVEEKKIIVYAHNGGKFDYHLGILDFIEPFADVTNINGRLAKFNIGECEFRDSYNILPVPLSEYQKESIDYEKFRKEVREKPKNKKEIEHYLFKDCEFLFNLVSKFIDRFGLNLTIAGTAMKEFKKRTGRIPPKDVNGELFLAFKKYYHGGRCQSFYHGILKKPFKMFDIRSAYPFAMTHKHPFSVHMLDYDYQEWLELPDELQGGALIAVVCAPKGCFPIKGPDRKLYFPDDKVIRRYFVTGWEFKAALDLKLIGPFNIENICVSEESIDFKNYVLPIYEERKEAKEKGELGKADAIFLKLLLNSLYGKFGSNPFEYRNFMIVPNQFIDENLQYQLNSESLWDYSGEFGNMALTCQELQPDDMHFYNVATAASITGFVRAFMLRAMHNCKGLIYCDTDSIAAESFGKFDTGIGKNLGQWEIEGEFKGGAFSGKKLYAMEYTKPVPVLDENNKIIDHIYHKIASKGVRLNAELLYKVARGDEIIYKPHNPVFSVHKPPHYLNKTVKLRKSVLTDWTNLESDNDIEMDEYRLKMIGNVI